MAVNALLVQSYANNIYKYGNRRFTERDGYQGIPEEYHPHVKQYAADKYYIDGIERAYQETWINADERLETLVLKGAEDPQYRP